MATRTKKLTSGFALVFAGALALSACSSSSDGEAMQTTDSTPAMTQEATPAPAMSESPMATDDAMMDPAANLVGAGCAAYAEAVPDGAGSVLGMSQDPVAVAASNNPLLTTLVAAVSGQLNPDVDLTVTGSGDNIMVNGESTVICGGVQTANATVYLIDTVLMPPAN